MRIARYLISALMLGMGAQAQADNTAAKITCRAEADTSLDTKIGFMLPMPEGFEQTGDPPREIHLFASAEARAEQRFNEISIGIWARTRNGPDELDRWKIIEIDHPRAKDITVRSDFRVKKNGSEVFYYVMIKGKFALFVRGKLPVDLNSVFDCFV